MLFPQNDTFIYYSESKDSYGTITASTGVSCKGYIEQETTFAANGAIIGKGKIFTTEIIQFQRDAKVTVAGEDFYISTINYHTVPDYTYYELSYV